MKAYKKELEEAQAFRSESLSKSSEAQKLSLAMDQLREQLGAAKKEAALEKAKRESVDKSVSCLRLYEYK